MSALVLIFGFLKKSSQGQITKICRNLWYFWKNYLSINLQFCL